MALFVSSFHFLIKVASQIYIFPFLLVITEINEGYEEKLCTPSFAVVKCCDVPQGKGRGKQNNFQLTSKVTSVLLV